MKEKEKMAYMQTLIFMSTIDGNLVESEKEYFFSEGENLGFGAEEIERISKDMSSNPKTLDDILFNVESYEAKEALLRSLLDLCYIDGEYSGAERNRMKIISNILGIEAKQLKSMEKERAFLESKKSIKKGFEVAKNSTEAAKDSVIKLADNVVKTSKETQMAVLKFVDNKKNAKFFEAKMQSFEDGVKAGKIEAVEYIKKYANFCMAATAVSFYFARCDGEISQEEQLEIQFDLDSITKNKDLPPEIKNKLAEISTNQTLSFEEVAEYLDGVGVETLFEFQKDIDEIIIADGIITKEEEEAKAKFDEYLRNRMEDQDREQCGET